MAQDKLTQEQKEKYLASPVHCPFCNSTDISAGFLETEGNSAYCTVDCKTCGKSWRDVYTLTEVEDIN